MPLATNLTTNEVKDSSGTEVEFLRRQSPPGNNDTFFAKSGEQYNLPVRLRIAHLETGVGSKRTRQSLIRFDETSIGSDSVTPVVCSFMMKSIIPVGLLSAQTVPKNTIAYGMSFLASLGASTTILYDCTGSGAVVLLNGTT